MPVPARALTLSSVSARSSAGTGVSGVSLDVGVGELHVVLGENLSGASEVLAVSGGYLPVASGQLLVDGVERQFTGHEQAEAAGVVVLRGAPSVVPHLSVAENVFLGRERAAGGRGFIRFDRLFAEAGAVLASLSRGELAINPARPAGELGLAERRIVSLARAVVARRRVVLVDEPFTGLDARGLRLVQAALGRLAASGVAVVVATARVDAVVRMAAESAVRVTVLSRGRVVEQVVVGGDGVVVDVAVAARLILHMTSEIRFTRPVREELVPGAVVFEVRDYSVFHTTDPSLAVVRDVSFEVRRGEIVGLAGLDGSGSGELALSLFGRSSGSAVSGEVLLGGHPVTARNPSEAIAVGIGLSTDANIRYDLGLLGGIPSRVTPSMLARLARLGFADRGRTYEAAGPGLGLGGIGNLVGSRGAAATPRRQLDTLKAWLAMPAADRPRVVILDHPTAGLPVPDVQQVRSLVVQLAASGTAVLLASADLAELLVLTDRIYTMAEGRMTGVFPAADATPARLLTALVGL